MRRFWWGICGRCCIWWKAWRLRCDEKGRVPFCLDGLLQTSVGQIASLVFHHPPLVLCHMIFTPWKKEGHGSLSPEKGPPTRNTYALACSRHSWKSCQGCMLNADLAPNLWKSAFYITQNSSVSTVEHSTKTGQPQRIIGTISFFAHADFHTIAAQKSQISLTRVLAATIGVMQQTWMWSSSAHSHHERIGDQLRVRANCP